MAVLDKAGLEYLWGKLKSAFVRAGNVANNTTTTAAGYVLDARQGKALSDLIAGKISEGDREGKVIWSGSATPGTTITTSGMIARRQYMVNCNGYYTTGYFSGSALRTSLIRTIDNNPDVHSVSTLLTSSNGGATLTYGAATAMVHNTAGSHGTATQTYAITEIRLL